MARHLTVLVNGRDSKEMSLGTGAMLTFGIRCLSYLFVAAASVVVARYIGPRGKGIYSLVTTVAITFALFANCGVTEAGIYLVRQRRFSLQQVAANNVTWAIFVSLVWAGLVVALKTWNPRGFTNDLTYSYAAIAILGASSALLSLFLKDLLRSGGNIIGYNLVDFAEPLLRLIAIAGMVLLLGLGVVGALTGWLLAVVASCVVAVSLLSQRIILRPGLDIRLFKAQFAYGLRGYLGYLLQAANFRLDVFLVGLFAGATALGYYSVAFSTAELLWLFPAAVAIVLFPKVSEPDAQSNVETAVLTCRRSLLITLIATLGLSVVGPLLIIGLYGRGFQPALTAFYILLPSGLCFTVYKALGSALAGRGMPESTIYAGLVSLPFTIVLDLALIPRMGIEGAATASVTAYAINAGVLILLFRRVSGLPLTQILLVNRDDIAAMVHTIQMMLAKAETRTFWTRLLSRENISAEEVSQK